MHGHLAWNGFFFIIKCNVIVMIRKKSFANIEQFSSELHFIAEQDGTVQNHMNKFYLRKETLKLRDKERMIVSTLYSTISLLITITQL